MKEEKVLQYIADMAVQATEGLLALEDRVNKRFDGVDQRFSAIDKQFDAIDSRLDGMDKRMDGLDRRMDGLCDEMHSMRIENLTLHGEVIGYLKRAEQERMDMSAHLRRHDEQIEFLIERVR